MASNLASGCGRFLGNVLALLAVCAISAFGASYYVATNGSDAGDGSAASPFKTIQKAASLAKAGDVVYIRAGVYRETVVPANSGSANAPIIFCAYKGDSVVVSGADPVSGPWTLDTGKIYRTDVQLSSQYSDSMSSNTTIFANQVFVNGEMMPQCRWPNLTGTNAANPNFTTNVAVPKNVPGGLTGAIIWQSSWFVTTTGTINNADATSITWHNAPITGYEMRRWVVGARGLLDAEREWHYDVAAKRLYVWTPGSGVPANVEAKVRNFAFDLRGKSYISIKRVNLFASTIITDAQSRHAVIDHITARYPSHYVRNDIVGIARGIGYNQILSHTDDSGLLLYGPYSQVLNSRIIGSAGNGITVYARHCDIYNNLFIDCNYQGSYASPVHIYLDSVRVLHNSIRGTGRDGLCWDTDPSEAKYTDKGIFHGSELAYNDIGFYGRLLNDLGSIYICCSTDMNSSSVHHTNTHDLSTAAPGPYGSGGGVYFDNGTSGWCAYQNIGSPDGEITNDGEPGPCPANINQSWPVPAGCNMPGCGGAEGKTLLKYPGIPDSVMVPDPVAASGFQARPGRLLAGQETGAMAQVYDMTGTLVGVWSASELRKVAGQRGLLGLGTYVVRTLTPDGARASRLVVSAARAYDRM